MSTRGMREFWLALAITGGPTTVSAAEIGDKEAVDLEVVSHVAGVDGVALESKVGDLVGRQLARRQVSVDHAASIRLTISIRWRDEARTTYAVDVALAAHGEVLVDDRRTCELCSTTELFETISFAVARVVRAVPEEPSPPPDPVIRSSPESTTAKLDVGSEQPTALTGLGWGGVGVAVAGLAVLSAGAAVWSKGLETRPHPTSSLLLEQRDFRPSGIALVVTGASVLAAGVAMVAVDGARQRRRRRLALVPRLGPTSTGLTLQGRF